MGISFCVNKFISVKLEGRRTKIYVNNEFFRQCSRLIFQLPKNRLKDYDEVNSIDDMVAQHPETIRTQMEQFSPKEEFWGHCSNLQTWAENNYDTRILHSNLSFPLLKKLSEVGDVKARHVFKEEIAERFVTGNTNVRIFLLIRRYFNHFTNEELRVFQEMYETSHFQNDMRSKDSKGDKDRTVVDSHFIEDIASLLDVKKSLEPLPGRRILNECIDINETFKDQLNIFIEKNKYLIFLMNIAWSSINIKELVNEIYLIEFLKIFLKKSPKITGDIVNNLVQTANIGRLYAIYDKTVFVPSQNGNFSINQPEFENPTRLKDIKFIGDFKKIKTLNLMHWRLVDIRGIERFENLDHLKIGCNKITNLSSLLNCKKLKYLKFWNNPIADIGLTIEVLIHVERNKRQKASKKFVKNGLINEELLNLIDKGERDIQKIAESLNLSKQGVYIRLGHLGIYEYIKNKKLKAEIKTK